MTGTVDTSNLIGTAGRSVGSIAHPSAHFATALPEYSNRGACTRGLLAQRVNNRDDFQNGAEAAGSVTSCKSEWP